MPQNRKQETIYTIMMVIVMVYAMICYNVALNVGGFNANTFVTWIQTTVMNFPMAFFWQLFAAGPLIRFIFGKMFFQQRKNKKDLHTTLKKGSVQVIFCLM